MGPPGIKAPGIGYSEKVDTDIDPIRPTPQSMSSLANDYIFINYGALSLFGNIPVDPISWFHATYPKIAPSVVITSKVKLIAGLGSKGHSIVAAHKQGAKLLIKFLDALCSFDRDRRLFIRPLKQQLPLIDFTHLDRYICLPDKLPLVNAILYGIDSNIRLGYFLPPADGLIDVPTLRWHAPLRETVFLANEYFKDNLDMFRIDRLLRTGRSFQSTLKTATTKSVSDVTNLLNKGESFEYHSSEPTNN